MTALKAGNFILIIAALALSACTALPTTAVSTPLPTQNLVLATATQGVTPVPTIPPTPTTTLEPTVTIVPSGPATCQVTAAIPTPNPTAAAQFPSVTDSDWSTGPANALITIIEYGDYQDTSSAQLYSALQQLLQKYPQDVRLVFRHFPLSEQYDKDVLSAQAAEAAGAQGKFWEFSNALYTNQKDWTGKLTDDFTTWAVAQATSLGLNADQFKTDMLSQDTVNKVAAARSQAVSLIQAGTLTTDPFLFFNEFSISSPYNLDILTEYVEYFKLSARAFTACPPMGIDSSKTYTATLHTEKGDIVIQLYADKAPWAVNSFVYLANQGWYNGSGFFRVIPGYLAQAGDPSNSGLGNPGYTFSDELTPDLRFDKPGVVGMANSGPNTNGSQFFITYAAEPSLDGSYTVFGQVTSGLDVLTMLRPRDPDSDSLLFTPDPILTITIEVK